MLPHHLHEEATVQCLEAGKHVLLEKPMAISLSGCQNILASANKSGKFFMVSENAQYWPEVCTVPRTVLNHMHGVFVPTLLMMCC